MEDIITAIGSWLTETHETRRRVTINLETLFWIATVIVGALTAKEYAAKRKAMMLQVEQVLPEKDLVATSFGEEDGQPVKCVAVLRWLENGYTVSVTREVGAEFTEVCSEVMPSLEGVELYLRNRTSFVLSDFRHNEQAVR
ncbi:hypothetical protein [Pseudomonas corrugata]|uniref:hypothetical protein n=1 Tax=Pseudomonas corrugata TaxID=47879 RepID=UPI0022346FBB|nr:hypothetical protein [Pseudomonas corrugata]UZE07268.1 hypothetical protein LOY65_04895 [Pseudomonas corrugata]